MRTRTIIATFCAAILLGLAVLFRYDVRPLDQNGYVILRHDRWSGAVERCTNVRSATGRSLVGCTSYVTLSDESWLAKTLDVVMFWQKKEEPAPPPPPPATAEPR